MRLIAHADFARSNNRAVEGHGAIQFTHNAEQYRWILCLSIGIKSSHDAAIAQFFSMNPHVANGDDASGPVALFQVRDIGKKNVRAKAAMVNVQVTRGAVSGNQQRQNVKGLWRRNLFKCHRFTGGVANQLQGLS